MSTQNTSLVRETLDAVNGIIGDHCSAEVVNDLAPHLHNIAVWLEVYAQSSADVPTEQARRLRIHRRGDWVAFDDGETFWAVPVRSVTEIDQPVSGEGERDSIVVVVLIPEQSGTKTRIRHFQSDDVAGDLRRIVAALGTSGW